MRVTVFASGSGGNASLYEAGDDRVLVDCGIPLPSLQRQMQRAGVTKPPTAVVLTHAHADHYGRVEEVADHYGLTVWMSESVHRHLALRLHRKRVFGARTAFTVGGVTVAPLPLPHDAPQVALKLSHASGSAVIATDLGEVTADVVPFFRGCDAVLIESNHDVDMLRRGPYSASLKRRILSAKGHLSNDQTHALLRKLDRAVSTVVLMHLSEKNNLPDIARDTAADALCDHPARLLVASQTGVTQFDCVAPQPSLPGLR